mmetsp:Transcript_49843/g.57534  ORF Transcript_49843/g.57534 Transcript_49843/m.57534 type:complete len:455 (-) Transcript_49843:128-1492(-)
MDTKDEQVRKEEDHEYFYDESDENDEDFDSVYTNVLTKNNERKKISFIYMCGRRCHPVHDYYERKEYEASLFWWTYRYNFSEIKPYCITSDAGWGCMLRSAQMMLTHALRIHFKSRHWKPETSTSKAREDYFVKALLTWFADFPSKNQSIYSLHNMCAAGLAKYEVLPGEWYGPGTACYVMRDLVALHQQQQANIFRVHVSSEGTLYKQTIYELMTKDGAKKREKYQFEQQQQQEEIEPLHPLHLAVPEKNELDLKDIEWDTSLLLLIPLRLGLDVFNEEYVQSVAQTFSIPQSVGILGGRPRGARWFYGAYADGSKILGLDPHTLQSAPKLRNVQGTTENDEREQCIDLTDEYISSVHTAYPEVMDLNRIDPSIALGFYCRNRKDFIDLEKTLTRINPNSSAQKLVSFLDKIPDYMSSTSVNGMMGHDLDVDGVFDDPQDEISDDDEDDYVLL